MQFKRFSVFDLIIIAVMAAVGIAIKPIVSSLAHIVSAPLMIPGGALAGGLYMIWLVIAAGITGKYGAATLAGLVQAVIMILTGAPGSHGIMSVFSYGTPGLAADILLFLLIFVCRREFDAVASFFAGMISNLMGTFSVNVIFFHLPPLFLALTLLVSAVSGGIGGIIAWQIIKVIRKYKMVRR
jgi:hypothetical protein